MKIIFLCIFGLFGCISKSIFYIILTGTIMYEQQKDSVHTILEIIRLFWNGLEILFVVFQIRLFYLLNKHKVKFGILFRYGSASALSANAALWLLNIFYGSLSLKQKNSINATDIINASDIKSQQFIASDIKSQQFIHNYHDYIEPFTDQMIVSFSLLSLSFLLSLWGSPDSAQIVHVHGVDVNIAEKIQERGENDVSRETDTLSPQERGQERDENNASCKTDTLSPREMGQECDENNASCKTDTLSPREMGQERDENNASCKTDTLSPRERGQECDENHESGENDALLPRERGQECNENNESCEIDVFSLRALYVSMSKWEIACAVVTVIFLVFPMVGLEACIAFNQKSTETICAFYVLELINNVFLLLANVFVLHYLRFHILPNSTAHSVNLRNNFLMFLSFIGFQIFCVFNVFAHFKMAQNHDDCLRYIDTFEHVVNFISNTVQTMLLVQLKGYSSKKNLRPLKKLKIVFILIIIMNLGLWLGDCFFMKRVRSSSIPEEQFFGNSFWYFMVDILCPMTIFYRFHSATESVEILQKLYEDKETSNRTEQKVV